MVDIQKDIFGERPIPEIIIGKGTVVILEQTFVENVESACGNIRHGFWFRLRRVRLARKDQQRQQ
jgi:hypothetical protein